MTPVPRWQFIVFDLDGVLIDSRANMEAAWRDVQARCGYAVPFERYFAHIGLPFRDILRNLGLTDRLDEAEVTYARASIEYFDLIRVYPGVRDALAHLQRAGALLGIVTSKDAVRTALAVERIGIAFDAVQAPATGLRGKPSPDQLLAAAHALGIPPAEVLYVGDMAVDALTARNAGAQYAHAAWGYGAAPMGTRLMLLDPGMLVDLVVAERKAARIGA